MKGMIFDIDHFAVHDGPGIRTTIYLKGCPLRCHWCHSPESQRPGPEILFAQTKCISCGACVPACQRGRQHLNATGLRYYDREGCTLCQACTSICPTHAISLCGFERTTEEVVQEGIQDKVFYKNSGGGVTLTGGEVLFQPLFAIEVLKGFKANDIHTIVETCGFGEWEHLKAICTYTDTFYYDVKVVDEELHRRFTDVSNRSILSNLAHLAQETDKIVLRVPLIPNYTDTIQNITAAYQLAIDYGIQHVHLLPYNPSAGAKYEWVNRPYIPGNLKMQDNSYLDHLRNMAPQGLIIEIIR